MTSRKSFLFWLIVLSSRILFAQEVPLFEKVPPSKTGVTFKNMLRETPTSNVLTYEYFFNGGGTAVGDINNDGLDDIYFTSNMGSNKLYLNQGSLKFSDVTKAAGVACTEGWKTGVTMADVNGDGWLDIYVCFSGKGDPNKRRNKLFINNKNLTFTDKAKEVGLDDPGYATHASFFDFDRDGDLDMYQLNHNVVVIREFQYAKAKETRDPYSGDKLFRNDNGHFVDISAAAGIKGNPLGFGLGITVADVNKDGWLDMYVSNDYVEPDYLYINNQNGTFTDRMIEYMQHISHFSMGCDVSDINNDEWPEIFTVDMLPEDNKRQKLLYGPENYEAYSLMVLNGFYFQNMRNMLHLNNGDGTYSEIGQFAGISNTDWSWAPLFADYDNDGLKDLFVSNGYYRDYTNRDFLKYKGDYYFQKGRDHEKADTFHLVSTMTSTPLHNYIYKNNGDLTFSNKSDEWGFSDRNFSNGASYSDLDNDGDLDLIVNNENATASIHKNLTRELHPEANYIQLQLMGRDKNSRASGAKVSLYVKGERQYFEKIPSRGFQSAVSDRLHAGLGNNNVIDSIRIVWLSGEQTVLKNIKANQVLTVEQTKSLQSTAPSPLAKQRPSFEKVTPPLTYAHVEQGFNDFKRQPLLMTMLSACGPIMAQGDVNNDGLSDVFVGGAEENPGKVFIQTTQGSFVESGSAPFNRKCTDADAAFFDADGDKDLDLYVVSGGYNDYEINDRALKDRLYINDGTGKFTASTNTLPDMKGSKSCVTTTDFDHDGDIDLFVGGRVIPGRYPETPESYLLMNNGGRFENVTALANGLSSVGMVSDAKWLDVNADGWDDLVVIGEFMPIEIFLNNQGKNWTRATEKFFDQDMSGLWGKMLVHDFDKDGDQDIIAGNFGLNSQLKASVDKPMTLVYKDFDNNGSVDPILNYYIQEQSYPFASRDELLDQMYSMRPKFTDYASYASAKLNDIFSSNDLKTAKTLKATELLSVYLENKDGKFVVHKLPDEAQFSPIYALTLVDHNSDGNMDFIASGNQTSIRLRIGAIDANFGQLYEGDGKGNFKYIPQGRSGLSVTGDTKSLQMIDIQGNPHLLVGVNNMGIQTYKLNRK